MVETETLDLAAALGRVLAQTIYAPLNLPPFAASAMDGYALRRADFDGQPTEKFEIVGHSLAGHPFEGHIGAFQCARIFTGALVPPGADQVLLQEQASETKTSTGTVVRFDPHAPSETFIRPIGHDIEVGQVLAQASGRIHSFLIGTLAAAGIDKVDVYRLPKVGVFSTGDELVDPGTAVDKLIPGQIYDSNRMSVLSLLSTLPLQCIDLGRLPDSALQTESAMISASKTCDILITSGGVSVGDADFVTDIIRRNGELKFWKLNLKPGKPLAFGKIGRCHIFGLPGNPVATVITLLLVVKPTLWHIAGAQTSQIFRISAQLESRIEHTAGRAEYQRGTVRSEQGKLVVSHTGDQSSNRLSSFTAANCLVEVPKEAGNLEPGSNVSIIHFAFLI